MTHTALPPTSTVTVEVGERPAAARWHKDDSGRWLVKVRASVHRPGRAARVHGKVRTVLVTLGDIVAELDGTFVLSAFVDPSPKPPRKGDRRAATERQQERLRELWTAHGGGQFINVNGQVLAAPDWENLRFSDASWYIDALKSGVSR
ncbi:Uncharacterised protein [Mycobacteroides abscessus subsp. massiliense]|uniref:hypothetical protein n=1 Tax=Mycobacteroides TaxID=670516 RepID=UPI00092908AD|nr:MULTISPECIES: hypothetical protein [Mycobacteroides]MBV0918039.1 hypothetical protein [Mycobacteroides chelonae]RIT59381.1 hypothetical protein D2E95_09325 [Mycobacteroides abscessus]SHX53907.1 Uncharacterised protein [Mycobacteroides abscessus subsp. abscessus]SKM75886.1 Uncharacterised protein [Mycobacteroides abscessus subsp. massiliense]SKM76953.1 Uncharacterised protein [Mycobacteroides abscessus subsp. massiliense]